ncbi:hypothetical protein SKAU_G00375140 [Synaphobranchus kaupii]|uniref:Uncharacterized protein n=1 Tax=Synaphobranchus kaupii TaxID=118154 RepID=A0A9Q1IE82_SYNKA|nr:hypothetical protein SKAU_G00375140 [Synaphobranchus kaupii]
MAASWNEMQGHYTVREVYRLVTVSEWQLCQTGYRVGRGQGWTGHWTQVRRKGVNKGRTPPPPYPTALSQQHCCLRSGRPGKPAQSLTKTKPAAWPCENSQHASSARSYQTYSGDGPRSPRRDKNRGRPSWPHTLLRISACRMLCWVRLGLNAPCPPPPSPSTLPSLSQAETVPQPSPRECAVRFAQTARKKLTRGL